MLIFTQTFEGLEETTNFDIIYAFLPFQVKPPEALTMICMAYNPITEVKQWLSSV